MSPSRLLAVEQTVSSIKLVFMVISFFDLFLFNQLQQAPVSSSSSCKMFFLGRGLWILSLCLVAVAEIFVPEPGITHFS